MEGKEIELVRAVKKGDNACFDALVQMYEPLINKSVQTFFQGNESKSADKGEMRTDAMMALHRAACTYSEDKNVTFGSYAKRCIDNKLISYLRKLKSLERKRKKQIEAESLHGNSEEGVINTENFEELQRYLSKELTDYEMKVLYLGCIQKKSYEEMAGILDKSVKSVGNALYRARRKCSKYKDKK